MSRSRKDRVATAIHHEMTGLVQSAMNDPRLGFVTVTGVDLSQDLRRGPIGGRDRTIITDGQMVGVDWGTAGFGLSPRDNQRRNLGAGIDPEVTRWQGRHLPSGEGPD